MSTVLSKEEKERILRALETDREFRYAMMGLLGFSELLERFARLEERFLGIEERQTRLEGDEGAQEGYDGDSSQVRDVERVSVP